MEKQHSNLVVSLKCQSYAIPADFARRNSGNEAIQTRIQHSKLVPKHLGLKTKSHPLETKNTAYMSICLSAVIARCQ
jgi:hypothetical protein